jgi:three-Cys-motif partner protein
MSEADAWRCRFGGRRKPNGNCEHPAEDGLPCQCVHAWTARKHDRIRLYLQATRAVRAKYIPPIGTGGAAFLDLFAGPGRARIQNRRDTVEGSPLIVLRHQEAPFTRVILCDHDPENAEALRRRTEADRARTSIIEGDCNAEIDSLIAEVPEHGLNMALLDPFGPKSLKWSTIRRLGSLKRMDLLIHFPTGALKRNFDHGGFGETIDSMVGTNVWRATIHEAERVPQLIDVLRSQLVGLGYDSKRVDAVRVSTEDGLLLYHLVFASKDAKGTAIWTSITKHDGPQRGFSFGSAR